jgi:hypothetical protein
LVKSPRLALQVLVSTSVGNKQPADTTGSKIGPRAKPIICALTLNAVVLLAFSVLTALLTTIGKRTTKRLRPAPPIVGAQVLRPETAEKWVWARTSTVFCPAAYAAVGCPFALG